MGKKGFTIIELMVAVMITVVVLTGLLHIHTQTFSLYEVSRNKTIAVNAARQQLERIRSLPYDDASSTNDVLGQNGITFPVVLLSGPLGANPGSISIVDDPDYPGDTNIREIIVAVSWIAQGKVPGGSIQLVTRRARY
ncbi:MAG: prepilin-type N-terminal cleavage/methylation domain-containing protein [Candidatus Omnitrophica bacterium]|nr:prepilin-type N-terminal cleavage/methylation domain-containing protein [Candidatus Omnitrophota bacterium]